MERCQRREQGELAACKDTSKPDQNASCSRSSTDQFANGPKRSMGHVLGAEKINFLIRVADGRSHHGGRGCGILSIPAGEVSLGSPRVGTIHVQAPTPYAPPLPAYFGQFSQQCPKIGACGASDYPLPDLPREASRSRSTSEKSAQFGPDGASFPSKTSITRGPPVVAVAVSLDPILPQR